jgi:hypothetical protein
MVQGAGGTVAAPANSLIPAFFVIGIGFGASFIALAIARGAELWRAPRIAADPSDIQ